MIVDENYQINRLWCEVLFWNMMIWFLFFVCTKGGNWRSWKRHFFCLWMFQIYLFSENERDQMNMNKHLCWSIRWRCGVLSRFLKVFLGALNKGKGFVNGFGVDYKIESRWWYWIWSSVYLIEPDGFWRAKFMDLKWKFKFSAS